MIGLDEILCLAQVEMLVDEGSLPHLVVEVVAGPLKPLVELVVRIWVDDKPHGSDDLLKLVLG